MLCGLAVVEHRRRVELEMMDAAYYRRRAEEVRAEAGRTADLAQRDHLLEIAAMYGQLAAMAEDSATRPTQPK